jgi:hypothetical protein
MVLSLQFVALMLIVRVCFSMNSLIFTFMTWIFAEQRVVRA